MKAVQAELKDGNLIITIPANNPTVPSNSGKSRLVATTSGNVVTDLIVEGKPVTIGLNAYIKY
jgi:hypothetical protein